MANVIQKISAAIDALQAGKELANSSKWKKVEVVTPLVTLILSAIPFFVPLDLTMMQIHELAFGIATIGVTVMSYFATATTSKIGVKPKK